MCRSYYETFIEDLTLRGCQVEMFFTHLLIAMTIEMLILFMILVGRLNKATYCLLMQLELIPMVAIKVASMNTKICLTENADPDYAQSYAAHSNCAEALQ